MQKIKLGMAGDTILLWENLGKDGAGEPHEIAHTVSLHVQISGNLSGAKVMMAGSNYETPGNRGWALLTDAQNFPVTFTGVEIIKRVASIPRWVRPGVMGGDENTKVTVSAVVRGA